ncbi:uncharacterized protein TNCV_4705861 [Trichonephila clavipes]|nr:uncharacterized protein TNCV_4705861 [Trichonephila clavipes]
MSPVHQNHSVFLVANLIDFTELQYSTLMCALKVFESSGEYGTIQRLSTSISMFRTFRTTDLPPSSTDRQRYSGYPSLPVIVSETTQFSLGYRFVHFPSDMHDELLLNAPHGPWIIFLVTTSNKFGSMCLSGISAEMI